MTTSTTWGIHNMTVKYTQEQANTILEAFKLTIPKGEPLYVRVRNYGVGNSMSSPFVPSTSTIYSKGFVNPLDCREFVIVEVAKRKAKIQSGSETYLNENITTEKMRELIGKNIERRHYDNAMSMALKLNDKTLIAFITRLIRTAN